MTNVWPKQCVALFELCRREEFARARDLYRMLTPSFHLDTHVKLVQYIKLAEHLVYGAPEWTRSPRLTLVGAARESVIDRTSVVLGTSVLVRVDLGCRRT